MFGWLKPRKQQEDELVSDITDALQDAFEGEEDVECGPALTGQDAVNFFQALIVIHEKQKQEKK